MRNIGDLFKEKKKLALKKEVVLDDKTIFFVFKKAFKELYGSLGEENIETVRVYERKLYIKPKSSLWANEVLLQKDRLVQKTNEILEGEYLVDIVLTQRSFEGFKS
jgi:chromosome condensin MukBEF MukE localization factor